MPAIWFGTVVHWEVTSGANKAIKHKDTKNINAYISDDVGSEEAKPRIVREYIKKKNDNPDLWKDYGKGLLQVYDIDKTMVTPPRLPSDDE